VRRHDAPRQTKALEEHQDLSRCRDEGRVGPPLPGSPERASITHSVTRWFSGLTPARRRLLYNSWGHRENRVGLDAKQPGLPWRSGGS